MGLFKEFKDFAVRGNVVDLAVAVVIGSAFGQIVTSLVNDILMPPIGLLVGGINFSDYKVHVKSAILNVGNFIQAVVNFIIIAFAIFLVVRAMNRFKKKREEQPPPPSKQEILLTEIRDILKNRGA